MSGALGGIISCSAGLDLWSPPLAFTVGFFGACMIPASIRFFEKLGIDDAMGAVSVHGVMGIWGLLSVGLYAVAYPLFTGNDPIAAISFTGQIIGAGVMFSVGIVPGYIISLILLTLGVLRVTGNSELAEFDAD
jgi:ammonia channel protein AmtB